MRTTGRLLFWANAAVLVTAALGAIVVCVQHTAPSFWVPAFLAPSLAFAAAWAFRKHGHWPSTSFAVVGVACIAAVMKALWAHGIDASWLVFGFFGLLYGLGAGYLLRARPALLAHGYLRPPKATRRPTWRRVLDRFRPTSLATPQPDSRTLRGASSTLPRTTRIELRIDYTERRSHPTVRRLRPTARRTTCIGVTTGLCGATTTSCGAPTVLTKPPARLMVRARG